MSALPSIWFAILASLHSLAGGEVETARTEQGEGAECVMMEVEAERPPASAGATEDGPAPGAGILRAAGPVTVYLNRDGGIFTPGEPNDSRENVTSVPDQTVAVTRFDIGDQEWTDLVACVADLFAPFDIVTTDADPGSTPHLEAVIGGEPTAFGLSPTVAGVSPFLTNCGTIDDSIVFVFPSVIGADKRRLCETVAQEVAHSFGLDHQYLCPDPMTYLTGCGEKHFLFQESVCGEFEPRDCKCSPTQNSARMLLDRVGRGDRPAIWLTRPSPGDVLAAGFGVQAVITHTPILLELYVDGVLITAVAPEETGEPYQFVDFVTSDSLRSGTHQVEVIARYDDEEDRRVTVMVEVEGVNAGDLVTGGCAAGAGGAGGAAAGALLLVLVVLSRVRARGGGRRPRRVGIAIALLALASASAAQTGCKTTVVSDPPDDIESGCRGAGQVSPAIAVLWSESGGTCTGTLVARTALITAAHCVAGAASTSMPIVTVLGGRQYIAAFVESYPDWQPGAQADDVAAVILTRRVDDVEPLMISPQEPAAEAEFTLVGHGDWTPQDTREAERQAQVGKVTDVQARSFSYSEEIDQGCLGGRGGGPVLAGISNGRLLGLHGEGRRIMRADQYACWLSCAVGPGVLPAGLPDGCDCARSDWRPCGDCGAEFLDFGTGVWSVCEPAADLHPCPEGSTCSPEASCVP